MGLYDREYYRDDEAEGWGEWLSGRVVVGLIVVSGALYFVQLLAKSPGRLDELWQAAGFDLQAVLGGQVWRLFTPGFLHDSGNLLVIVFNMLMLYIFGNPVEQHRGGREFLGFFVLAVLVSYLGEFAFQYARPEAVRPVVGSVGAVNGVIVLFCFLNPRTQLPLVSLPFWPLMAFVVGMNVLGVIVGKPLTLAPYPAQTTAAALLALAYFKLDWRIAGWLPSGRGRRSRPALRVVRPDEPDDDEENTPDVPVPAAPAPRRSAAAVDEQLEAKVDFVLEKVARSGKDSLTAEENQILLRASEIYKRRRGT